MDPKAMEPEETEANRLFWLVLEVKTRSLRGVARPELVGKLMRNWQLRGRGRSWSAEAFDAAVAALAKQDEKRDEETLRKQLMEGFNAKPTPEEFPWWR